jgi:hypothetical protein
MPFRHLCNDETAIAGNSGSDEIRESFFWSRHIQIDGRRVLLTGANRGLSKALARTFIAAGGVKVYPSVRGTQKCGEDVHP